MDQIADLFRHYLAITNDRTAAAILVLAHTNQAGERQLPVQYDTYTNILPPGVYTTNG